MQARIQVLGLEGAKFGEGSGDRLGPQSGPGRSPDGAILGPKNLAFSCQISIPQSPPWGPGGLSRECVLRNPMRVVKGD